MGFFRVRRQSIKKQNFWNSEPVSARSKLAMVALCSGDFKLYSDASNIMPCQLFIEIDSRGDRRKFDKRPSLHPAKHFPGRVPELDKTLGAVYQEWRGVLWRRKVWQVVSKAINLKSSVSLWTALVLCSESNKFLRMKSCLNSGCVTIIFSYIPLRGVRS